MKALLTRYLACVCAAGLGIWSVHSAETTSSNLLAQTEAAVQKEIAAFKADDDVEHLEAAFKSAASLAATAHKPKFNLEAHLAEFRLKLKVAEVAFRAREKNYFETRPEIEAYVRPPGVPGEIPLPPGTPPDQIKDPKLRQEYEKAIAENERKLAKRDREDKLDRLVFEVVSNVRFRLQKGRYPSRDEPHVHQTLTNAVQDAELRALLLGTNQITKRF